MPMSLTAQSLPELVDADAMFRHVGQGQRLEPANNKGANQRQGRHVTEGSA